MKISRDQKGGGGGERESEERGRKMENLRSRIDHLRLTRDCLIKLDSTSARVQYSARFRFGKCQFNSLHNLISLFHRQKVIIAAR